MKLHIVPTRAGLPDVALRNISQNLKLFQQYKFDILLKPVGVNLF